MCGRFFLIEDAADVKKHFKAQVNIEILPRYNIAPSQNSPVICYQNAVRQLQLMRWGLIPHWSKESRLKYSTINARAETVATKPVYRMPFKRSRCLVPASGFFEWQKRDAGKQPYLIKSSLGLMAFAGLWDHWEGEGKSINSFTIIVTDANSKIRLIHDRMPVILDEQNYDDWLNPDADAGSLKALLKPCREEVIELFPVSRYVNSPKNDDPQCIQALNN